MDTENAQALSRLKMRAFISETILMRLYAVSLRQAGQLDAAGARAASEKALEELAHSIELKILSSPEWAAFADAERAHHADEFREIVAELKNLIP